MKTKPPAPTRADQFPLRLPRGWRDRLKQVAARNGRSMNREILGILEASLPPPSPDDKVAWFWELLGTVAARDYGLEVMITPEGARALLAEREALLGKTDEAPE